MNNVEDRVPTQVLSNGAVRWEQFDSSGNSLGYIFLKRADEPAQEGTPLNKVLFDSIKTDLNSRLPKSYKATQAQAQAGTDNTNYMTPLRVEQHYTNKKATQAQAEAGTDDNTYMTPLRVKQSKLGNKIHISTGTVNRGDTIPQTSGYTNYYYYVSVGSVYLNERYYEAASHVEVSFSGSVSVNQSTRVVTCSGIVSQANYIEIAWN